MLAGALVLGPHTWYIRKYELLIKYKKVRSQQVIKKLLEMSGDRVSVTKCLISWCLFSFSHIPRISPCNVEFI